MNQDLQRLLKAYREFHEAPAERSEELGLIYEALLLEHSKRSGFAQNAIEQALKRRHEGVVRAETKRPSTIPPKA